MLNNAPRETLGVITCSAEKSVVSLSLFAISQKLSPLECAIYATSSVTLSLGDLRSAARQATSFTSCHVFAAYLVASDHFLFLQPCSLYPSPRRLRTSTYLLLPLRRSRNLEDMTSIEASGARNGLLHQWLTRASW